VAFLGLFLLRRRRRARPVQLVGAPDEYDGGGRNLSRFPFSLPFAFRSSASTSSLSVGSSRGWHVEGSFFRPMEEPGFRVVTRTHTRSRESAASLMSVPSVSEDPFWDPSQVRPLAIVPVSAVSRAAASAVNVNLPGYPNNGSLDHSVSDPFEDPHPARPAGNPFQDPPEYHGTPRAGQLIGPSRVSNGSSMFGSTTEESGYDLSGLAV